MKTLCCCLYRHLCKPDDGDDGEGNGGDVDIVLLTRASVQQQAVVLDGADSPPSADELGSTRGAAAGRRHQGVLRHGERQRLPVASGKGEGKMGEGQGQGQGHTSQARALPGQPAEPPPSSQPRDLRQVPCAIGLGGWVGCWRVSSLCNVMGVFTTLDHIIPSQTPGSEAAVTGHFKTEVGIATCTRCALRDWASDRHGQVGAGRSNQGQLRQQSRTAGQAGRGHMIARATRQPGWQHRSGNKEQEVRRLWTGDTGRQAIQRDIWNYFFCLLPILVRCMVAVLLMVGQGLEQPGVVASLLDITATPCKPNYTMAPESEPDSSVTCKVTWENVESVRRATLHGLATAGTAHTVRMRLQGTALSPLRANAGREQQPVAIVGGEAPGGGCHGLQHLAAHRVRHGGRSENDANRRRGRTASAVWSTRRREERGTRPIDAQAAGAVH
ncbi:tRNA pseudouridine synthase [Haematococcus lacustris]|uniref:tRNA pseudouridine synthase n=1 Tax=Haematococcus lacustris TaxID=44745 RepID=A0A699YJA3_HAELA|nr:tRNA pseudouridine synthase [Haematococcus lacustris]